MFYVSLLAPSSRPMRPGTTLCCARSCRLILSQNCGPCCGSSTYALGSCSRSPRYLTPPSRNRNQCQNQSWKLRWREGRWLERKPSDVALVAGWLRDLWLGKPGVLEVLLPSCLGFVYQPFRTMVSHPPGYYEGCIWPDFTLLDLAVTQNPQLTIQETPRSLYCEPDWSCDRNCPLISE